LLLRFGAVCLIICPALLLAQEPAPGAGRRALSPFAVAKAVALMRDRFPCAGCHIIEAAGGRVGPDLSRVAERRSPTYIRRMIEDPQSVVPGTVMPKVPMPTATRELIIAYLASRQTKHAGAAAPALPRGTQVTGGAISSSRAALYRRLCASCHGSAGRGDGPNARYLPVRPAAHSDSSEMARRSDDRLFDAIFAGGYPLGRNAAMPPFGETLTRAEIWSLVDYMRELCRCSGPTWSAKRVSTSSIDRR
jgi:mono/diheme cytochrome c family protein